jgi:hemolysin activation/secretion protein
MGIPRTLWALMVDTKQDTAGARRAGGALASLPTGLLQRLTVLRPLPRLLRRTILPLCGWGALLAGVPALGQTYDQLAPKPVREAPVPAVIQPPAANPVSDDSTVLVPRLAGLRLIPSADRLNAAALPPGSAVSVEGLPWLPAAKVEAIAAGFLSRPLTRGDLTRLTRALVILCRNSDHPVVDVYVPPQDVSGGVVQVVVVVARLGAMRVEGGRWFSERLLTGQVRLKPGQEITSEALLQDVDWLNQNPFRQVDLVYARGQEPGQTDVILRVADARPERVYAGYDDSGNQETGLGRLFAGFNLGDLWDADHELNYQYTRSTDAERLQADSASYVLPLPWRQTLSMFGSWARAESEADSLFNLVGTSWQVGLRYAIPLPVVAGCTESLTLGADYKWTNNNLGFGGTQVFSSPASIAQAVATYSGVMGDSGGTTRGSVSVFYSPGGLGGSNDAAAFDIQRAGATATYGYVLASVSRLQRLPGGFTAVFSGLGQWSSARLLATEQFGLGGEDSVRGYDDRLFNGDDGISGQLELRTPSRHLLGRVPDQSQALLFLDAGRDWQNDLRPNETEATLLSAGPGLRLQVSSHGTIKADYGWQLERQPGTRPGRVHLSAILSF